MRPSRLIAFVLPVAFVGFALWVVTATAPKAYGVSHLAAFGLTVGAFIVMAGLVDLVLRMFHRLANERIEQQPYGEHASVPAVAHHHRPDARS